MVGFPTETDDEFRDLIDFMDTVGFDYTSVFAYSREEGSLAAKMEGQVDEEVKLVRARRPWIWPSRSVLPPRRPMWASAPGDRRWHRGDRGRRRADRSRLVPGARFRCAVHLDASEASVGDILTVEFTDSFCYELIGHVVE
mgnify:CR=1 FL=1